MVIKDEIANQATYFISLCENHHVKYLYAFGSSTTDAFDKNKSDIDLLIEIDENDPLIKGESLISLWDNFEEFFHRKVDLLTYSSIKNPILKKNIEATKVLLYDGKRGQIFI